MHYDPNYKNQFFHASSNSIGIKEAFGIARRELQVAEYKTKMPKSKIEKAAGIALAAVCALILIITAVVWLVSRSFLFTIVLFLILAFLSVGVMAVFVVIEMSILRRNCSEPVEATCIGYSISGETEPDSSGGGLMRSPVFEYEYHGMKCMAFDGMYDNFSQIPLVSQKTTILVNPSDPEDIVWNFGKKRSTFLILAGAFASVLSLAIFFVILNDDNFMNSAFSDGTPQTETVSESNPESGSEGEFSIQKTADGKVILNDAYLRNEIFTSYPDSEYIIKTRKITGAESLDNGEVYIIYFEPDPDCSETDWYFLEKEATDEVKNASAGDEFIYAEVKGVGAAWVFNTKEYATEGE